MERSSPSRTMGVVAREVTLAGNRYLLNQPDRVRKAADEEAVVLSRRLDLLPALSRACATLPVSERDAWRREYVAAMVSGIATAEEWAVYFRSTWQLAFRFWSALDPKQRGDRSLTDGVAWAYEIVNDSNVTRDEIDALWLAIRIVSQEDLLGESSGSAAEASTPLTANQTTEAGQPS
jgi:hypothetical protein